jgi:hypothetical protein
MKNKKIQQGIDNRKKLIKLTTLLGVPSIFAYSFFPLSNLGYPLVKFMVAPVGRLDDFYNQLYYSSENLVFTKANFTLYPLSVLIYKFFSFDNVNLAAVFFLSLNIIFFVYSAYKFSKNWFFILLVVTSYPFLFTLARGNNEILLVSLAMLAYHYLIKKKYKNSIYTIAVQFLVEPFPTYAFQYITIFQRIKKQLKFLLVAGFFIFLAFLSNESSRQYLKELTSQGASYSSALGPGTTLHSSSLSGFIQFVFYRFNGVFPYEEPLFSLLIRILFVVSMLGLLFFILSFRNRVDLVTSSLLIISSYTLFFAVTFDYRLLHFVIPLGLLLMNKLSKIDDYICISIIFLFIPKPFILFTSTNNSIGETLGSVVNPLVIIFIIALTLIRFFRYLPAIKN